MWIVLNMLLMWVFFYSPYWIVAFTEYNAQQIGACVLHTLKKLKVHSLRQKYDDKLVVLVFGLMFHM